MAHGYEKQDWVDGVDGGTPVSAERLNHIEEGIFEADGIPGPDGEKGDQGPKGDQGIPGVKGDEGERGSDGIQGEVGPPGDSDIVGPEGPEGPKGDAGQDGADGQEGPRGEDGLDGTPGTAGQDGAPGTPGTNGEDGTPGLPGTNGEDGAPGTNGEDGTPGAPGTNGEDGLPGTPGTPGTKGDQGIQGEQGPRGHDGTNGLDGTGIGILGHFDYVGPPGFLPSDGEDPGTYRFYKLDGSSVATRAGEIVTNNSDPNLVSFISIADKDLYNVSTFPLPSAGDVLGLNVLTSGGAATSHLFRYQVVSGSSISALTVQMVGESEGYDFVINEPMALYAAAPVNIGDVWLDSNLDGWVWTGTNWENVGKIQGEQGEQGPEGIQGPEGPPGDAEDLDGYALLDGSNQPFTGNVHLSGETRLDVGEGGANIMSYNNYLRFAPDSDVTDNKASGFNFTNYGGSYSLLSLEYSTPRKEAKFASTLLLSAGRANFTGDVNIGETVNAATTADISGEDGVGTQEVKALTSYPATITAEGAANFTGVVDAAGFAIKGTTVHATNALRLPGITGNYASAPYTAAMGIAGDIDVRWFGSLDDWTPAVISGLVARYAPNQVTWALVLMASGLLRLYFSDDGAPSQAATSTLAVPATDGESIGVRATLDVDNGTGGKVVTFYTSTDNGATWDTLGDAVPTAGTVSLFPSTAPLEIGSVGNGTTWPEAGTVQRVEVRDGINGTIVANPDFAGDPTNGDSAGNIWEVHGSESSYVYTPPSLHGYAKLDGSNQPFTGDVTADGRGTFNGVVASAGYDINAEHAAGDTNTRYGVGALNPSATGHSNAAIGYDVLKSLTAGGGHTGVGLESLSAVTNENGNTGLGRYSGKLTTGSSGIFLGDFSGAHSTAPSLELFINSRDRVDREGDVTKSIVYGQQTNDGTNQKLTFNADVMANGSLNIGEAVGAATTMDVPDEDGAGTQEVRALTYPATITADGHGAFASVTATLGAPGVAGAPVVLGAYNTQQRDANGQAVFELGYAPGLAVNSRIMAGFNPHGSNGSSLTLQTSPHDTNDDYSTILHGDKYGHVGVGTTSPQATLHAIAVDASTVGLLIQGVEAQTADLFKAVTWDTGAVLASITAEGRGTFASVTIPNQSEPPTPTGGGTMFVQDGALKFIGSAGTITTIGQA